MLASIQNWVKVERRRTLILGDKIKVIHRYEKGVIGAQGLAQHFGVGKS